MRFSQFDFDVITTPADPPKPTPQRDESVPRPERRPAEREPAEPPDGNTGRPKE